MEEKLYGIIALARGLKLDVIAVFSNPSVYGFVLGFVTAFIIALFFDTKKNELPQHVPHHPYTCEEMGCNVQGEVPQGSHLIPYGTYDRIYHILQITFYLVTALMLLVFALVMFKY